VDARRIEIPRRFHHGARSKVRLGEASTAFLEGLKTGKKCYDSYQETPAQAANGKDWALFSRILKPVLEQIQDNVANIRSWKDWAVWTGKKYSFDSKPLGDDATTFLTFVSSKAKRATNDRAYETQTYFIQFASTVPKTCTKSFRVSISIDETLNAQDRWTELARVMTSLVVSSSNNQYAAHFQWGKIETPEMMRVDPLLLRFCYTDWNSAKAILDELNQKLSALQPAFKNARTAYPALQGRSGVLSFADYTTGSSFGTDICTEYGKALTAANGDKTVAVNAFKAKWETDVGPIENYGNKVPDASAFRM
jgi:hypothetical protein